MDWALIAEVALFGLAQLGALLYLIGSMRTDINTLKGESKETRRQLATVQQKVARIEGQIA